MSLTDTPSGQPTTASFKVILLCLCLGISGISLSLSPVFLLKKQANLDAQQALSELNSLLTSRMSNQLNHFGQELGRDKALLLSTPAEQQADLLNVLSHHLPDHTELKLVPISSQEASNKLTASTISDASDGNAIMQLSLSLNKSVALQLNLAITPIIQASLNEIPSQLSANFVFSIYDLKQQAKQPFYQKGEASLQNITIFRAKNTLRIADREWLIESPLTPKFKARFISEIVSWVWLPGCLLTILLCLRIWHNFQSESLQRKQLGTVTNLLDLNERALENKKIEKNVLSQALIDSEKRTRDFLMLSNDYFWELDTEFNYVFASPQTAMIKGIAPQTLMEKSFFDFLVNENTDAIKQKMQSCIKDKKALSMALSSRDADNNVYQEIIKLVPLLDNLGAHIGFRGTGQRKTA